MNFLLPVLAYLLEALVEALFPKAPKGLGGALARILPDVVEIVDDLADEDLPGAQKREAAIAQVGALLDQHFDGIPKWKELKEEQRDRIIVGVVELAWFFSTLADPKERRRVRRALRRAA